MVRVWEPVSLQLVYQTAYILTLLLLLYNTWVATKLMSDQQTGASGSSLHSWHGLELGEMRRLHIRPALFHHVGKGEFHPFILHRFMPHSTHVAFWYVSCVSPRILSEKWFSSIFWNFSHLRVWQWAVLMTLWVCDVKYSSRMQSPEVFCALPSMCKIFVIWEVVTGYTCFGYLLLSKFGGWDFYNE